jgi:putative ABC transport system ATP-binding protein
LRQLCDELGQTIVMVTHDPKAASYADRIVFLNDGRVIDEMKLDGGKDAADILARLTELEL